MSSHHPAPWLPAAAGAGLTPHFLHTQPGFPLDAGLRDLAATVDVPTATWAGKMLEYPTTDLVLTGPGWPWYPTLAALLTLIGSLTMLTIGARLWRRHTNNDAPPARSRTTRSGGGA